MAEKKLTEHESLAIITDMIQRTKRRYGLDHGRNLLLWGYVGLFAAAMVYTMLKLTGSEAAMLGWLLIPLLGCPLRCRMKKRYAQSDKGEAKSYVDAVSGHIWLFFALCECAAFVLCLCFWFAGREVWGIMYLYTLTAFGSAVAMQGIVIREWSLVPGGMVGIAGGLFVLGRVLSMAWLGYDVLLLLFMACFVTMTIIPGHIINHKAKRLCSKS